MRGHRGRDRAGLPAAELAKLGARIPVRGALVFAALDARPAPVGSSETRARTDTPNTSAVGPPSPSPSVSVSVSTAS